MYAKYIHISCPLNLLFSKKITIIQSEVKLQTPVVYIASKALNYFFVFLCEIFVWKCVIYLNLIINIHYIGNNSIYISNIIYEIILKKTNYSYMQNKIIVKVITILLPVQDEYYNNSSISIINIHLQY